MKTSLGSTSLYLQNQSKVISCCGEILMAETTRTPVSSVHKMLSANLQIHFFIRAFTFCKRCTCSVLLMKCQIISSAWHIWHVQSKIHSSSIRILNVRNVVYLSVPTINLQYKLFVRHKHWYTDRHHLTTGSVKLSSLQTGIPSCGIWKQSLAKRTVTDCSAAKTTTGRRLEVW